MRPREPTTWRRCAPRCRRCAPATNKECRPSRHACKRPNAPPRRRPRAAPAAPPAPAPAAPPPSPPASTANANRFNPAISLILSGLYTRTSQDPADYTITGFARPEDAEIGPGTRGLSLAETELTFSASIDPWWRGAASIALTPDNEVELEEAFVQTTALGNGLTLKAGRFLSNVGYLNPQHAHVWDFVDAPLAYQALLGGAVRRRRPAAHLAGADRHLCRAERRGRARARLSRQRHVAQRRRPCRRSRCTPAATSAPATAGAPACRTSTRRRASRCCSASTRPTPASTALFSGRTRVTVLDAVWKWAPDGNATRTNFKLQGE